MINNKVAVGSPPQSPRERRRVYTLVPQWRTLVTIMVLLVTNITAMSLPTEAKEARAGCVILATAILWVTEGMPLMITALLPAVMFPLAGVLDSHTVCGKYFNYISMLMLGSFLMAEGIESCGLHRRIALKILSILGRGEALLMMGAMFTTWLLSMFMSNTATTAMMLPIMGAIINSLREINSTKCGLPMKTLDGADGDEGVEDTEQGVKADSEDFKWFCKGLLLSIPYGASIGGIATLTGTPPNLVMKAYYEENFPTAPPLDYGKWLFFAFPLSFLLVIVGWTLLVIIYARKSLWSLIRLRPCLDAAGADEETKKWRHINKQIRVKYDELGSFRFPEIVMLLLSLILILLWLTRSPEGITGWGKAHAKQFGVDDNGKPLVKYLDDAWVVVMLGLALFIIPKENPLQGTFLMKAAQGTKLKRIPRLLDMDTVMKKTPWDVLFILGGGYAIAAGCSSSKLDQWLGAQFSFLEGAPQVVIAIVISAIVAFLTEFASNTASTNLLMPILKSMSLKINVHPLYLMITGTISASLAFCLPSATGPNALVFSFKEITVLDMFRTGFVMNCICVLVTVLATSTWISAIMGLDEFPDWALNSTTLVP